jgi:ABC-type branched-subunit amino acid transport system substrate-binding protein
MLEGRASEMESLTVILTTAVSIVLTAAASAGELTPQEERGKQIYFQGTSPSGTTIEAYVGEDLTEVPGTVATCASCHGPDGRGRPEAGVIPSDVTWSYLVKPYGHVDTWGRSHPAFTVDTLKESIVLGRDPAGNELDPSMPIYSLSDQDLDDLVAYMRKLETDLDPGLSESEIRIGTVLPARGTTAEIGQGIREVLAAFFDQVNAGGGIHGRKLRLVELPEDAAAPSPLARAARLAAEGDVFAVLSPVVAGAEAEIVELAERERIPVIGPLTLFSPDPFTLNDYTFYVYSGLAEQVRALVDFAAAELALESSTVAVLGPADEGYGVLRAAVEEQGRSHGWTFVLRADGPDRPAAVILLGADELTPLVAEAEETGWTPWVLLPGAFADERLFALPAAFRGKVYLSYPTVPADQTAAGIAELRSLLESRGHALRHRASQVSAFVSAKLLMEGLKGAGRDSSRAKLLRALEKLYEFETGLTPAITYGANRRVGALGAYVVAVDLEKRDFVPVGGWRVPSPVVDAR